MYIFILNWDLNAHLINIYLLLIGQEMKCIHLKCSLQLLRIFLFSVLRNTEHYAQNTGICVCVVVSENC